MLLTGKPIGFGVNYHMKRRFRLDALFEFLYPGYSNGPVFKDERGFLVNTPYGDTVEVLLSDVRAEILGEYKLVIVPEINNADVESTLNC